jgi:hypothetical protein
MAWRVRVLFGLCESGQTHSDTQIGKRLGISITNRQPTMTIHRRRSRLCLLPTAYCLLFGCGSAALSHLRDFFGRAQELLGGGGKGATAAVDQA